MQLVRIPRYLLHAGLDDLSRLGVSERGRSALVELVAELPIVPDASASAQLLGSAAVTLPGLAVLARHVGQGLRDHNLSLAHDRARLRLERRKLIFLEAAALEEVLAAGDVRPVHEAALFVVGAGPGVLDLLAARHASGLVSFVTSASPIAALDGWHQVHLS